MDSIGFPVGVYSANAYLLWSADRRAAVVDPGGNAPFLLQEIARRRLTVETILLTHAHFDHLLAAAELQQATGAPLFVHEADVPALSDPARSLVCFLGIDYPLTADRALQDGNILWIGQEPLTVIHTPGHTPGSCCYRADSLLLTGDTLFAGSVGRADFPGGNPAALSQSLETLKALPNTLRVLPGHGEETTLEKEKRSNPYMRETQ